MSLSTYRQEQRADQAATAEQRRLDAAATEERRAERRRAEDERAARLREQARTDHDADRAARRQRRQERAERWSAALTPENIYRRGTLGLVASSGLASLPAQVLHFVSISPMLLPLPLALEGAAWVMAAAVAYADARGLPGWVRWMLRGLVVACAAFAAHINYGYGLSLEGPHGLSHQDASTVGAGLAAVTILGPAVFEIRQWVSTIAAATGSPDERDRRRHAARRRRHHRKVLRVANRLVSAAPFGALPAEDAWGRAWGIVHGCEEPSMTPDLHRQAVASAERMRTAQQPPTPAKNAKKTSESAVNRSTAELEESTPAALAPVEVAPTPTAQEPAPVVASIDRPVKVVAAAESRPRRATGRVPRSARAPRPQRTPEQLLDEARSATADWPAEELTAEGIRKAVRTSPQKARGLRETLRAERSAAVESPAAE
ncbi:hypothetical protein [Streptomyces sioyaensis]|uniref:hypothetical protein n=1 Tax=Streptomyces sioyaensis TaxID=67364 RepID=UPI00379CFF79